MSARATSRARIARVRRTQHGIAAARAMTATGHVAALISSDAQLDTLRRLLTLPPGQHNAAALARMAELASRIDTAQVDVARNIAQARETARMMERQRVERHIAQTAAERLAAMAARADRIADDKRRAAITARGPQTRFSSSTSEKGQTP